MTYTKPMPSSKNTYHICSISLSFSSLIICMLNSHGEITLVNMTPYATSACQLYTSILTSKESKFKLNSQGKGVH